MSKLRFYRHGTKVIRALFHLLREERPILCFTVFSAILQTIALVLAYPVVLEFLRIGLVRPFSTAILPAGISLLAALNLACAFTLDTATRRRGTLAKPTRLSVP